MRSLGPTLVFVALLTVGCGGSKDSDIVGDWKGWLTVDGLPPDDLGEYGNYWTLTLNDDGSYEEHLANNVMMKLAADTKGTYRREGDTLVFTGISQYTMDDGYGKPSSGTKPERVRAKLAKGCLWLYRDGKYDAVFLRGGQTPHTKRRPQTPPSMPALKPSDPEALKIIDQVDKRYASLKSYSDEGHMESAGYAEMAPEVTFRTRFLAPKKFVFEAALKRDDVIFEQHAAWTDGKKSWHRWIEKGQIQTIDLDLPQAISARASLNGYVSMLIAPLLMTKTFPGMSLRDRAKEFTLLPEQDLSGKPCWVLSLRSGEDALHVWIEKSSHLILRMKNDWLRMDIRLKPKADVTVPASELAPTF